MTDEELAEFENRHGTKLTGGMRSFYQKTNGTTVGAGQDHESYAFWPIAEVQPESQFPWAFNFADYREMSWWYAIDLTGGGAAELGAVYFIAIGRTPLIIAHSFCEFLELYVRGNRRLRPNEAKAYHESIVGGTA